MKDDYEAQQGRHIRHITHERKEPPTFTSPIQPTTVKEGYAAKYVTS